jgi:hypothetical protein
MNDLGMRHSTNADTGAERRHDLTEDAQTSRTSLKYLNR